MVTGLNQRDDDRIKSLVTKMQQEAEESVLQKPEIDYRVLEKPTIMRNQQTNVEDDQGEFGVETNLHSGNIDLDLIDIPAFLRRKRNK